MNSIKTIWSTLKKVKTLKGKSLSLQIPPRARIAEGKLSVKETSPKDIYFKESGNWIEENKKIPFTNDYHWQLNKGKDKIAISHLRQGKEHETLLGIFTKKDEALVFERPHLCGEDVYIGSLTLSEDHLLLNWDINGPNKNERLSWLYYFE